MQIKMIKFNAYSNKALKALVVLSFFTLPRLGFSDEVLENNLGLSKANYELIQELLDNNTARETQDKSPVANNVRSPRTREGSQALIGTWVLSNPHNSPLTDIIIINGASTSSEGVISAAGSYIPENATGELSIICLDNENNILEYRCFAVNSDGGFVTFFFIIDGNTIASGSFGIGQSIEEAANVSFSEEFPISGYRLSSGAKVDASSGELTIPAVEYKGQFYRVILKDQGGFTFVIKDATPVN